MSSDAVPDQYSMIFTILDQPWFLLDTTFNTGKARQLPFQKLQIIQKMTILENENFLKNRLSKGAASNCWAGFSSSNGNPGQFDISNVCLSRRRGPQDMAC